MTLAVRPSFVCWCSLAVNCGENSGLPKEIVSENLHFLYKTQNFLGDRKLV